MSGIGPEANPRLSPYLLKADGAERREKRSRSEKASLKKGGGGSGLHASWSALLSYRPKGCWGRVIANILRRLPQKVCTLRYI
jgi:hypothetical protein